MNKNIISNLNGGESYLGNNSNVSLYCDLTDSCSRIGCHPTSFTTCDYSFYPKCQRTFGICPN